MNVAYLTKDGTLAHNKKIIIAANRLPVTIEKSIQRSSGGLVSALEGVKHFSPHWIGWPGNAASGQNERADLTKLLEKQFQCSAVFLSSEEVSDYYHGFANACLWPALHYFPQYIHYDSRWWESYRSVNRRFAEMIAKNSGHDDLVWIHDYHLFLVPQMLRDIKPQLKTGFFLHTPFPSYEIFRCLPHREELLKGLLGSDLIGFHTYGYLRHFRSSITRLLSLDTDIDRIRTGERSCRLGVFPVGINSGRFLRELKTKRCQACLTRLKKKYAGQKIVLSIERLDYTKGILRRLEAIEKFLSETGGRNDTVFVFINIPSREEVKEYDQLKDLIEKTVGRINGKYGSIHSVPINFIHSSISFTELCALYSAADVAMVTPLIDGMNLVAKEFIACQTQEAGVLILSEFAGAANELFNAVIVNPYHIDSIVESLKNALSMPEAERRQDIKEMRSHVIKHDARHWTRAFLQALSSSPPDRQEGGESGQALTRETAIGRIKKSRAVTFFIDYDGTLREFESAPHKSSPGREIRELLDEIASLRNSRVYVISGRKSVDLDIWLGSLNVTLIAEHGLSFRRPHQRQWQLIHKNLDLSFREKALEIFQQYVTTTPGSFIETKESSLVWHYRLSDPEFGAWKAQHLIANLTDLLANKPACVHHGKCIVEVSHTQVHKGAALAHFLMTDDCDLAVCAGDDRTDENMFALNDPRLISIKVGKGDTAAGLRLSSPQEFRAFLRSVCSASDRHQKNSTEGRNE